MSSAPLRSVRSGELADGGRAGLVRLTAARRSHDWSALVVQLPARGVSVAAPGGAPVGGGDPSAGVGTAATGPVARTLPR